MTLISISARAVAHLGQADSVPVLPGEQPPGEDQSGSTRVDGTSHRGPDDPVNSSERFAFPFLIGQNPKDSHWT